jgi:heme A synthase
MKGSWLHRFALLTALATLGLVCLGGLVTSHGAGMSVPDWPNTYGYNLFLFPVSKWLGGIFYEHTHRLAAALVGLLTMVLAFWLWARETRGRARWAGLGAMSAALVLMGIRQMPVYLALAGLAPVMVGVSIWRIARLRNSDPSHGFGEPWSLPDPLSGRTSPFPSPRPSPLGRGRNIGRASISRSVRADRAADFRVSLSPRERAGVRGNRAHVGSAGSGVLGLDSALRWWGVMAFALVILQGVLGGLRVVLFKDQIGIFHAALAQLFFVLTCLIALLTRRSSLRTSDFGFPSDLGSRISDLRPSTTSHRLSFALWATTALIFAQLVLGATMRHQHAGLAIPDFPLAYGKVWPAMDADSVARYNAQRFEIAGENAITAFQIGLQMAHRIGAGLILAAVAGCAWGARRLLGPKSPLSRWTAVWLGLILVQALLGAATIWSDKAADIATAHVMVGSLALALGAMLSIETTSRSLCNGRLFGVGARTFLSSAARSQGPNELPLPAETATAPAGLCPNGI